jgi:two-component sensor histidine kinase
MTYREFNHHTAGAALTPMLQQMLDFVIDNLPVHLHTDDLHFRVKMIITELLANAMKHSGTSNSLFTISIDDDQIVIKKTDAGKPLQLLQSPAASGNKVLVACDILHNLFATFTGPGGLTFTAEDKAPLQININEVPEHFGLLIITKAATHFTYQFDGSAGHNIFTASINLVQAKTVTNEGKI